MRAFALLLSIVAACSSSPSSTAPATPSRTKCGTGACNATEICVPGGPSRNGIGETVQLPPEQCAPLPAACHGVATCGCVEKLCRLGGCASVDGGRLVCLAG